MEFDDAAGSDLYLLGGLALVPNGEFASLDVRVHEGVIAEVAPELHAPAGADVVTVAGFIMPGMIDAHTHLTWAGEDAMPADVESVRQRALGNRRRLLEAGVTTIRDLGSVANAALEPAPGPRVLAANQIICAPGGHGTETSSEWALLPPLAHEASGPEGFRAAVRHQAGQGSHLIKLTLNSATLEVTAAEAQAAVSEAHHLGLRVACHASIPEAIDIAIEAGADTIEHGNGATAEQLSRMAESGIVLVPTTWIYQQFLDRAVELDAAGKTDRAWPPPADLWRQRVTAHRTIVRDAIQAGVVVGAGSDAIEGCHAASVINEVHSLHQLGLDVPQSLRAATEGGAAALGVTDIGVIAEGAVADIIVFDQKPAEVVSGRHCPALVIQGGRRLHRSAEQRASSARRSA